MRAEVIQTFTMNADPSEDTGLNALLQKFWTQEDIPYEKPIPAEYQWCEEFYKKTTTRNQDGRYVVRLPFKSEFSKSIFLGSSRFNALGQYTRMERTLSKNPELQETYHTVLKEYLDLDHMEESSSQEIVHNGKFFHTTFHIMQLFTRNTKPPRFELSSTHLERQNPVCH